MNYKIGSVPFTATQFQPDVQPWPRGVQRLDDFGFVAALDGPGCIVTITTGDWVIVNLSSGHMSLYTDKEWMQLLAEGVFKPIEVT